MLIMLIVNKLVINVLIMLALRLLFEADDDYLLYKISRIQTEHHLASIRSLFYYIIYIKL